MDIRLIGHSSSRTVDYQEGIIASKRADQPIIDYEWPYMEFCARRTYLSSMGLRSERGSDPPGGDRLVVALLRGAVAEVTLKRGGF